MARELTVKQKRFVQKLVETGNGTQAAMDAYDVKNYNTAHAIASENLQKPTIKRELELALEHAGLSDNYISDLLREATVAGLGVKATNADSLRGIELVSRLKGHLDKEDKNTSLTQTNVYIEELKLLGEEGLKSKLNSLLQEIKQLQDSF